MAEFVEVMKQARRMCLDYWGCKKCPLKEDEGPSCRFFINEKPCDDAKTERIVLDWAAEHPEPVYPSWKEAWKSLFPDSYVTPCPKRWFGEDYYPIFVCAEHDCDYCKALPMHPNVAKKLGIGPIEIKKPNSCGTCKYNDKSVWEIPCGTCKRVHGDCYPDQREGENDAEVH